MGNTAKTVGEKVLFDRHRYQLTEISTYDVCCWVSYVFVRYQNKFGQVAKHLLNNLMNYSL